jgi:hypothetical protein
MKSIVAIAAMIYALTFMSGLANAHSCNVSVGGFKITFPFNCMQKKSALDASRKCVDVSEKKYQLMSCFHDEPFDKVASSYDFFMNSETEEFMSFLESLPKGSMGYIGYMGLYPAYNIKTETFDIYEVRDTFCYKDAKELHPSLICYIAIVEFRQGVSLLVMSDYSHEEVADDAAYAKRREWIHKVINSIKVVQVKDKRTKWTLKNGLDSTPSFDCSQARTKVEKTLCANKDLAALDVTLTENYDKARRATKGEKHRQLLDTQRVWLKQRNACKTPECLTDAYTRRIEELCEQHPESACPPDNQ